jgi:hypothetical protein
MDVRQRTGGSRGESGGRRRAPLKTPAVAGLVGLLHSVRAEPPPPVSEPAVPGWDSSPRSAPGRLA